MRVLGIDPGSLVTGFAVLETEESTATESNNLNPYRPQQVNKGLTYIACGSIRISSASPLPLRLEKIFHSLQKTMSDYSPDGVAIEEVFVAKNPQSALKLSHVRGVVMLASTLAGLEIYEYSPREVKQAVVGYGHADKLQVQKMVQVLLNLNKMPSQNAADALAVAICHLNTRLFA